MRTERDKNAAGSTQSFYEFLAYLSLPGLVNHGNEVIYRGMRPVFDIDGNLNADDVLKIKPLSISEAAMYGRRGYGSVIWVTTRLW